ncbi:hypothetical protein SAMN05421767_10141 [Granulicatella balaenopterae]|uniref:Uncharacterized protein n=1 Tax=Granulicatella balaenopterae TaxID=137733 RepID=A0A1H9GTG9_9LACT|nr:dTDP-glucose 4,6-dehydratase [Granulicatella balaenopterae]SEQ53323.1 hypothetical protein SAMN05421767_10141 [Granulicatella balaenopterae]
MNIQEERVSKMQQYLQEVKDTAKSGDKADHLQAVTELFNYYHSDWHNDAMYFADKNLELFDDVKMQDLFSSFHSKRKSPRTIIRKDKQSRYKRPMRPGED